MWKWWIGVILIAISFVGCGQDDNTWGDDIVCEGGACDVWDMAASIQAMCNVTVEGMGSFDVETEYLPRVIACENGNAPPEALRAQAIAARTYLLHHQRSVIQSGEHFQVFSCPSLHHTAPIPQRYLDAVDSTSGLIIGHGSTIICSFYVSGAEPSTQSCIPLDTDRDALGSEHHVTYNYCRSGGDVTPSTQGSSTSPANRGTMSQHGANCLATQGWNWQEILRFYYGDDIQIGQSQGTCITTPYDAVCGDESCDIGESCGGCFIDCGTCTHECGSTIDPDPDPVVDPTSCSVSGVQGLCLSAGSCNLTTHLSTPGVCGSDALGCCTPRDGEVDPDPDPDPADCVVDGVDGACIETTACPQYTFRSTPYYCPNDPTNIQCCTPEVCTVSGVGGLCMDISECSSATHQTTAGLCPGPFSIQCCTPR